MTLYRSIGRSMASRYAVYAFNVLSLMILTRIFTPEIFGVVAAVQTIVVLFQLVAEGGLSPAVVNLHHLEPNDRNGIFGLSLFIALAVAIIMLLAGSALAHFYNMPEVRQVVPYIAVALFANTSVVLPLALLQRQQFFKRIAQAGIAAELGALCAVFIANFHLSALHAYAIYFPVKALINFIFNWRFSKETEFGIPMPSRNFSAIKPLLGTTSYQLGFNFVNYFSRNLDNILVGKYLGADFLGIYDRSYQLMRYPLLLLTGAMSPAIQPALRGATGNPAIVNVIHRGLAFKLALLGSIAAISVYFLANIIVVVVLGSNWNSVVPIIRLLSMIIPIQMVLSTSGGFFQAFNRTDLMFGCGLFSAIVNIIAVIIGVRLGGLEPLCWALFISFHINFFQCYYVMHKRLYRAGFTSFLFSVSPIFVTSAVLAILNLH